MNPDERTPISLETYELWLLDMAIPDEDLNYSSEALGGNDLKQQIRDGLVFCYDNDEDEATLLVTENHVRLIDITVSPDAYIGISNIGKPLLLKAFRAGKQLRRPEYDTVDDPMTLTKDQVQRLLAFQEDTLDTD